MVNRKGYLKTLEAVLAIVLILLFTFAVTPKPEPSYQTPYAIKNAQKFILSEIAENDTIRTLVMNTDNDFITAFDAINGVIAENMPTGYDFTFGICDLTACVSNITPIAMERSVYTNDVLISSNGSIQNPKVVRLWLWRRGA